MLAAQPGLGAADSRDIPEQPQVSGKPQAARVGDALPVHQDQVGGDSEPLPGGQYQRRLPEGQQAGDVGKADFVPGGSHLHQLQCGVLHHHHRPGGDTARPGHGDVHPGDKAGAEWRPASGDLGLQPTLDFHRPAGADPPGVQVPGFHDLIIAGESGF